jgi:hypothetical protein
MGEITVFDSGALIERLGREVFGLCFGESTYTPDLENNDLIWNAPDLEQEQENES